MAQRNIYNSYMVLYRGVKNDSIKFSSIMAIRANIYNSTAWAKPEGSSTTAGSSSSNFCSIGDQAFVTATNRLYLLERHWMV